jgi:hypothetical protein
VKPCVHCGKCCLSGVPCIIGQVLFNITVDNPQPCPACVEIEGLYWCDLIRNPTKWFSVWVGNEKWKCEAMADIARIAIGIGRGCGVNPTEADFITGLKEYICVPVPTD